MKKTLLFLFAFAFIGLTGLFFARNPIAHFAIETEGSRSWGAPIRVEKVDLNLAKQSLEIHKLSVASQKNSQLQLAFAETLYMEITLESLLQQKIEIKTLKLNGLKLHWHNDTELSSRPGDEIATLADINLPNGSALIAARKSTIRQDLKEIRSEIDDIEQRWKKRLDSLPDQQKLEHYKSRMEKLRGKGDLFEKIIAARDLELIYKQIREDLRQIRSLKKDFISDRRHLNNQLQAAGQLPVKHSRELVASVGLNSDQIFNLASNALAGNLKKQLQDFLNKLDKEHNSANTHLPYDVILHQGEIAGPFLEQIPGLSISGNFKNITYPLQNATSPASLSVSGGINANHTLEINASIDHRNTINDNIKIRVTGLQIENLYLARNPDLSIGLKNAIASLRGDVSLQGETISGELRQEFSNSNFSIRLSPDASPGAELIAELLDNTSAFSLGLKLSGTLSNPKIAFVQSNLDQLLAKTIESRLSKEIERLKYDAVNELEHGIKPEMQILLAQADKLNGIYQELEFRQKTWQNIGK